VRYDHFDFRVTDRFITAANPDDSGARTMDAVSPSIGVTVRPAERMELFGSVSTSFDTPTTTELTNRPERPGGFNPVLQPTRGTTVEAGVRSWPAPAVSIELTAHRTSLRDELVPFEVQGVPGRVFFSNAGRSRHQGFEAAVSAAGPAGLSGRVAYSFLDAVFITYSRGGTVFDGNRVPGLAPHTVDAVLRWAPAVWFAEMRIQHRGAVPADDANTAYAASYGLVDLRGGTRPLRIGSVEVAPVAGIANVFDTRHVAAVTVNAFGGRFFKPGPGRTFHLGLRAGL
jgi:iron complex outermembrane receptor protein